MEYNHVQANIAKYEVDQMLQSKQPTRKNLSNRYINTCYHAEYSPFQPFTVSQIPFQYILTVFVDSLSLNWISIKRKLSF